MTRAADDAWSAPPEEDGHADEEPVESSDRDDTRAAMRRARARAMEVRS